MDTARADKSQKPGLAVWAITPGGIALGSRICSQMEDSALYLPIKGKYGLPQALGTRHYFFETLQTEIRMRFREHPSHIFIFAAGIAVRMIAALLESKTKDPGVVVMDEKGLYAISLVSGHLGGANALAEKIARITGAIPVITTATDINDLPSIDMVAKDRNLIIETPENIKYINMKFLKGIPVSLTDPGNFITTALPKSLVAVAADKDTPDLICTHEAVKVSRETMVLRPQVLSLGIGCNRNTPAEEILGLINRVFTSRHLSLRSIKAIGSTSAKADEKGLIQASESLGCPLVFYSNEQLNQVKTVQNPSKMAEKYLGVKSVCEAAAILGAQQGPLLITKQKTKNVTLAVALLQ